MNGTDTGIGQFKGRAFNLLDGSMRFGISRMFTLIGNWVVLWVGVFLWLLLLWWYWLEAD